MVAIMSGAARSPDKPTGGGDVAARAARIGAAAGFAVATVASLMAVDHLALLGTIAGLVQPGFSGMAISTATLFVVAGLALARHHRRPGGAPLALAGAVAATAAVAAMNLAALTRQTSIDELITPDAPAYMSPATSSLFALAAAAMALLALPRGAPPRAHAALVTAGVALSGVGVIGALFDQTHFYANTFFTGTAPVTAIAFLGLFCSVMLARPGEGWVALLLGRDALGARTRLLLGVAVCTPVATAVALRALTDAGLLAYDLRLSLLTVIVTLVLAGFIMRAAALEAEVQSERQHTMAALRQSLADREVLLGEVYHRVRNNLQQVNAMLMLDAMAVTDQKARAVFERTADRVRAMGAVHEMLMTSPALDRVDSADFLRRLCDGLDSSLGLRDRGVALTLQADSAPVDIDAATALALLINELVSNAVKHAFPDRRAGAVTVTYRQRDGRHDLTVSDDGVGLAAARQVAAGSSGLGSSILRALVRQLRGDMAVESEQGLAVRINAPAAAPD